MAANWTERLFEARDGALQIKCRGCKCIMFLPPSQEGQRAYCTLECRSTHRHLHVEAWAKRLWEKRSGTIEKACIGCKRVMHLPPSKLGREFCTRECRTEETISRHTKQCETCGSTFEGWKEGQRYCSQKCNAGGGKLSSPENLAAAAVGKRKAIAEGRVTFKAGADNPQWMGGPAALRQRQIASGKAAAWTRRYRKENPDKVAEFSKRRKGRKLGRLAYGSIPRIKEAQKNRCAICRASLRGGYHMDHITPLARGGKHVARNVQLLCEPCNLAKSARDPIIHMQSLGRLL